MIGASEPQWTVSDSALDMIPGSLISAPSRRRWLVACNRTLLDWLPCLAITSRLRFMWRISAAHSGWPFSAAIARMSCPRLAFTQVETLYFASGSISVANVIFWPIQSLGMSSASSDLQHALAHHRLAQHLAVEHVVDDDRSVGHVLHFADQLLHAAGELVVRRHEAAAR